MGIRHLKVVASRDTGTSADWNADHVVDDDSKPKNSTTLIIAADNSYDKTRADFVCDGIADDVEIQAAIDALAATGGRITMLEGTYILAASVGLENDIVIEGQGYATLIQHILSSAAFDVTSCTGVRITQIRFTGKAASLAFNTGVLLSASTQCMVHACWFSGFGSMAVWVSNCTGGIIVNNCFVSGCYGNGLAVSGSTGQVQIVGNDVSDNYSTGISVFQSSGVVVNSNTVTTNKFNGIYGHEVTSCIFSNNISTGNDSTNLALYDGIKISTNCTGNIVIGNICLENDGYEINILGATTDRTIVLGNYLNGVDHVGAYNDTGSNTEAAHNIVA